jgi:quinol monooxygenase YgiN
MSESIIVIARAEVGPEARARFIVAAKDCIAATRREPGCLAYDMHESVSEIGHFVFVERWASRADVDRHMREPHLQAFLTIAGTCVTAAPVIEVVEPRSIDRL